MKKCMVAICTPFLLLSVSAHGANLVEYRFDRADLKPDMAAAGIDVGDLIKSTGTVVASDGRESPCGMPHWKKHGTAASLSFTVMPEGNSIRLSSLSFAVQMDSTPETKERKLELTSSATGSTVLFTLYNYAGWVAEGKSPDVDRLNNQSWEMRKIDLTGIPALQGVTGPVTFALEFSDISTGSPEDGNLRLDNIRLDGNAGSEERVTTVNLIL